MSDEPVSYTCSRCGKPQTDYINDWSVSVAGQEPSGFDPAVGEYNDDFDVEFTFCLPCLTMPDRLQWMLMHALIAAERCEDGEAMHPEERAMTLVERGDCSGEDSCTCVVCLAHGRD